MRHNADSDIKNRLVEPTPMIAEVMRLMASGIEKNQIAVELSRVFYVDIDLLNAVLRAMEKREEVLQDFKRAGLENQKTREGTPLDRRAAAA